MAEDSRSMGERGSMRALIDGWDSVPALIRDRHLTVVASNPLARALSPSFQPGVNLVRFTFVDSAGYAGDPCWEEATHVMASMLRTSLVDHSEDGRFRGLVGELSARSERFSDVWAQEREARHVGQARFVNNLVGDLALSYRELWFDNSHDDALLVWHGATPESTDRLARLARLLAG